MALDFFEAKCQLPPTDQTLFGICDDPNGGRAFLNLEENEQHRWGATVKNELRHPVVFTAVDKCVLNDHDLPGYGRCDAMLTTSNHLYLIELKNQRKGWTQDAVTQLETTIRLLKEHHDISSFKRKKAFACNKKHPQFTCIDNEENLSFFRKTGFRLDIHAEIVII